MSRYTEIQEAISPIGWTCDEYAPGDGVRRIRFFSPCNSGSSYLGPGDGAYTALGIADAETFAIGLVQGASHTGCKHSND